MRPAVLGLVVGMAVLVSATLADTASAAYQLKDVVVDKSVGFKNPTDCAPTSVSLPLERGAYAAEIESGPDTGDGLEARDSDKQVGVVTAVRIRPGGRRVVRWEASPVPGGCRGHYGEPVDYDIYGDPVYGPPEYYFWDTQKYDFGVFYKVRRKVQLTRRSGASLASTALSRQFGATYNTADGYPRCRRPRRNRTSCYITFFAGDTYWVGRVAVRVGTTRNHRKLRWSYHLNVLEVDDYCLRVNMRPRSECTERIRRNRKRVRVPGGEL